jgi:lambda family phage minor tail protein L
VAKGIKKEIIREIDSINETAIIELFRLYYNYQEDPQAVLHFHGGTNNVRSSIYFDGQEYIALPVEGEGFEILGDQRLPRPKIKISNAGLYMSSILRKYKNLNNAKIERRRIFAKFLDDRNFDGGVNPWGMANPNARMPDDKYFINSKIAENKLFVELELVSSLELENNEIPAREVAARYCPWVYRGEGCRYGSTSFNILGNAASDGRDRPVSDVNDRLFVVQDGDDPITWKLNPDIFDAPEGYKQSRSQVFSQYYNLGCLRNRGLWNHHKLDITDGIFRLKDSSTFESTNVVIDTLGSYNSTYSDNLPTSGLPINIYNSTYVAVYRNAGLGEIISNFVQVDASSDLSINVIYSSSGGWTGGGPDDNTETLYIQSAEESAPDTWTNLSEVGLSNPPSSWTQVTIPTDSLTAGSYRFRFVQDSAEANIDKIAIAPTSSYLFNQRGTVIRYFPGDYVYTVSKRVEEGRDLTSNFYKNQRVYYVCKKGHRVSQDKYPPLNSEYWVKDACSKKIGGCKLRYDNEEYAAPYSEGGYDGLNNNKALKFGGFPGVDIYEY